jgi:hypothetical protein
MDRGKPALDKAGFCLAFTISMSGCRQSCPDRAQSFLDGAKPFLHTAQTIPHTTITIVDIAGACMDSPFRLQDFGLVNKLVVIKSFPHTVLLRFF